MCVGVPRDNNLAIQGAVGTRAAAQLIEAGSFRVNVNDINPRFWGLGMAFAARRTPGIPVLVLQ
jgi:hypothetical protein